MGTLTIQTAEKRAVESRDLKPGDVISQEFLDTDDGKQMTASRDVRLDRVLSAYLAYVYSGRVYLIPVITLCGWEVGKSRGVRITCTPQQTWVTMRSSKG